MPNRLERTTGRGGVRHNNVGRIPELGGVMCGRRRGRHLGSPARSRRCACAPFRLVRQHDRRQATVDDLEGCSLQRQVVGRVIAELCPRQPVQPCSRPIVRHASEVHGDGFIHRLALAVRLGWNAELIRSCTPAILNKSRQTWPVSTGSRSLTIDSGRPWRRTMSLKKARATEDAV